MQGKETNEEKKNSKVKKFFLYIGGLLSGVLTAIAVALCKRKDVRDIRDGFDNTREQLTSVQSRIRNAKDTNTEIEQSIDKSRDKIDECEQIIRRIREER